VSTGTRGSSSSKNQLRHRDVASKLTMLFDLLQTQAQRRGRVTAAFAHLGALGLFFLAILDSSPLPTFGGPDILVIILVATRPHPWYEYAGTATAGSVLGAYLTFRLARRAGRAYLDRKFGRRLPRLLSFFEKWGTGALIASTAIPFPLPTSVFFAAAGASNRYRTQTFVTVVALSRAIRYSVLGIIAHLYGRHIIRVLRHPTQYWGWLLLFAAIFLGVITIGFLVNRQSVGAQDGELSPSV
jgi:membrane protein YqaA with SNARE-associated domain